MASHLADTPIETCDDDRYAVTPFARSIAKSILGIDKSVGTVIALNGAWGAGKSSIVNLVRKEVEKSKDATLSVTEFKCWWFRGEEALILAFLQHLDGMLRNSFGDKAKGLIGGLCRPLLQAAPAVAPAIAAATGHLWLKFFGDGAKTLDAWLFKGETIEEAFKKVVKLLDSENKRFLVIIDDIDRLTPDEALAVFRLIKSVGHLPNMTYLVVFDRDIAEKAVQDRFPSEGPHFLEKIIQASFEVPSPLRTDLNSAILSSIEEICGPIDDGQVRRLMNLFYDVVSPYITSPRHIVRFKSAISVTWPAIANEVNIADFIALETLRLYEPSLFRMIRLHKERVCGMRSETEHRTSRDTKQFEIFCRQIPDERKDRVIVALRRLFPRLEAVLYDHQSLQSWDVERRICVDRHFDTYMRLTLSDEALSSTQIDELVKRADDPAFVKQALREASQTRRKSGASMVPVYLDELTAHAPRVQREKVESLLRSLFEIHDEIDLRHDDDKGFMAMANTTLRFHWLIRRLTRDRFTLEERTSVYEHCLENASLRWLVDFVRSAVGCFRESNRHLIQEEDLLVTESALASLKEHALSALRAAAANGLLIHQPNLFGLLYRWREFRDGDPTEAKGWTSSLLGNEAALLIFVRGLISISWSANMGLDGLGDRVATPATQVAIENDMDILDLGAFRAALERIRAEAKLDSARLGEIKAFLDAWDRKLGGKPATDL